MEEKAKNREVRQSTAEGKQEARQEPKVSRSAPSSGFSLHRGWPTTATSKSAEDEAAKQQHLGD